MKRKTNISVQDNTGVRVTSSLIVGLKASGYKSGDILDANAVQEKISDLVNLAPEALDSLGEIAEVLNAKANTADLANVAISGSYVDLSNKPTIPDVSGKENTSNKVTSISSSSTDTQYPSAKAVYDELLRLQNAINALDPNYTQSYNVGDILLSDGTIKAVSDLTNEEKSQAVGVCAIPTGELSDGKARFVSTRIMRVVNETSKIFQWESAESAESCGCGCGCGASFIETGLTNFSTAESAKQDFSGASNTATLASVLPARSAANVCAAYTAGGRSDWYLPTLGELYYVYTNYSTIRSILATLGTGGINNADLLYMYEFWSSSLYSLDDAWSMSLDNRYGSSTFGNVNHRIKSSLEYVVAFVAI